MKKLFLFLTAVILTVINLNQVSFICEASVYTYGRVLTQGVCLYSSPDEKTACFALPSTYYVKILSASGDYSLVEYYCSENGVALKGYCKTNELYICDYVPEKPYPDCPLEVTKGTAGYKSKDVSSSDYFVNFNSPVKYLGKAEINGKSYYYVIAYQSDVCYIPVDCCASFTLPLNTDPLPKTDVPTTVKPIVLTPSEESDKESNTNRIILILVIVVPALAATCLIFKPTDKKPAPRYFEEDCE